MKNKTVRMFAETMGVHPNTVYQWIRTGILPCLKLGGVIRIRPCDEQALFSRCEYDAIGGISDDDTTFNVPAPAPKDAYELGVAA